MPDPILKRTYVSAVVGDGLTNETAFDLKIEEDIQAEEEILNLGTPQFIDGQYNPDYRTLFRGRAGPGVWNYDIPDQIGLCMIDYSQSGVSVAQARSIHNKLVTKGYWDFPSRVLGDYIRQPGDAAIEAQIKLPFASKWETTLLNLLKALKSPSARTPDDWSETIS